MVFEPTIVIDHYRREWLGDNHSVEDISMFWGQTPFDLMVLAVFLSTSKAGMEEASLSGF